MQELEAQAKELAQRILDIESRIDRQAIHEATPIQIKQEPLHLKVRRS